MKQIRTPILHIENLCVSFTQYTKGLHQQEITNLSNLNLDVYEGEVLALLGSSGSGKSLLAHAILGVLPSNAKVTGKIEYKGKLLTPRTLKPLRGQEIFLVPQTVGSLDPLMKVGKQVQCAAGIKNSLRKQREVFEKLQLDPSVENMLPYQLSGGMARRVLLSTALVSGASLIVADEPTPGMDIAVVEDSLTALKQLSAKGTTMVVITHDIQMALKIADRVAVLHEGALVDVAATEDFVGTGDKLKHGYTRGLWRALPQNDFFGRQVPYGACL